MLRFDSIKIYYSYYQRINRSIIDDDEFIVFSWIKLQLNVYALVWSNYIKIKVHIDG